MDFRRHVVALHCTSSEQQVEAASSPRWLRVLRQPGFLQLQSPAMSTVMIVDRINFAE